MIFYIISDTHHGSSYQSGNDWEFLSVFRFRIEKPAQAVNPTFSVLPLKLSSKAHSWAGREAATYITSVSRC